MDVTPFESEGTTGQPSFEAVNLGKHQKYLESLQVHELARSYIETNDLILFKALHRACTIDFSQFDWQLGYESVSNPQILQFICENSSFVESQGWHILAAAVREKNRGSIKYLVDQCHINPDKLKGIDFLDEEYAELSKELK